jgi:hypothetical protein
MESKGIYIQPHPIWEFYIGINSFDDYKRYLPATVLSETVNDEIKGYYQPIHKLLEFGYFEYSFITIAFRNSINMLELILKEVYLRREKAPKAKMTLNSFINWLVSENLIDNSQQVTLSKLKDIRNEYSHPSKNSIVTIEVISIIDLILKIANTFATGF